MPRKTQAQRAEELGTTRNVLQNAKQDGIDIWKDSEIKPWLESRRPRIAKDAELTVPVADDVTIEDLEREVRLATKLDDVKILKDKIAALHQAQKMRKEERELISVKEVDERDTRNASAVKGALLKFVNDAPPMLEGLEAAKMQKILRQQMLGVLEQLASDQSEFWNE